MYVSFISVRHEYGEHECCGQGSFSCVLLSLFCKTTFKSNGNSVSPNKSSWPMFESLVEETEWREFVLIGWDGLHIWKTATFVFGMFRATLVGGFAWLHVDGSFFVCLFYWKQSGVDESIKIKILRLPSWMLYSSCGSFGVSTNHIK